MRTFIFIILIQFTYNAKSQIFFIRPNSDTIFFNSNFFSPDKKKIIYLYDINSFSKEKRMYEFCLSMLKISTIEDYTNKEILLDEMYRNYSFDKFVTYKTTSKTCLELPMEFVDKKNSALATTFVLQFESEPDSIKIDKSLNVVSKKDTSFNFQERKAIIGNNKYDIFSYGAIKCFIKNDTITIYNISCSVEEGVMLSFYVIAKEDEIRVIYNYYK